MESDEFLLHTLKAFLADSTDMVFVKDADLIYRGASQPYAHMAGLEDADLLLGRTDAQLFSPERARRSEDADRRALEGDGEDRIELITEAGDRRRFCLTTRRGIRDASGTVIGLYCVSRDVTAQLEMAEKNRELTACAATDQLTGALNRRTAIERITDAIDGGREDHALLFIDLDGFKGVNDKLGHPCGDRVLRQTAERLRQAFRRDDIVGRVGGDEFIVLLRGVSCRRDVEVRAGLVPDILPLVEENGVRRRMTCSIGVSMCVPGKGFEQLYAEADKAMYTAKAKGRNRIEFSDG